MLMLAASSSQAFSSLLPLAAAAATQRAGMALAAAWLSQPSAGYARTYSADSSGAPIDSPIHVCVVGSGPAGFYTIDRLLKHYGPRIRVTLLDRLPTPFGLVRSGVAPDHQDTKNVINHFGGLAADARVTFLGNVLVGRDVAVRELRDTHHAVVLAYGAESDRKLGIPGEDGPGVLSAREFVWWYNGHPDMRTAPIDLAKVGDVAICGIGNVALDCARLLLAPPARYEPTDVASHALAQLVRGAAAARSVHLVARRGPVQAACTPKELKELLTECNVAAYVDSPDQLEVSEKDKAEMAATRLKRRVHELVSKAVADTLKKQGKEEGEGPARALHFQFYRNPVEVVRGQDGAVTGLRVERTRVEGGVAVGTGQHDVLPCSLVLKSIGYKSLPLEGVPFDARRGVVPNAGGRVLMAAPGAAAGEKEPGLYVCGWLKRGPTGIIGTNLLDADETAGCIAQDTDALLASAAATHGSAGPAGLAGLVPLLEARSVRVVRWPQWMKLDAEELAGGEAQGRVRDKVVDPERMLELCGA